MSVDPLHSPVAEVFERQRPLLFGIAYRMLGSAMDAEDIVQEAYLRYARVEGEAIQHPKAYLAKTVTRLCLDQLKSAQAQRETYIGPWLPEPIMTEFAPDARTVEVETLSLAFLLLLEKLTPGERAVFVLREVFEYDYAEIADMLDKDPAACRQLLRRARLHIGDERQRFQTTPEVHTTLLTHFIEAVSLGDFEALKQVLTDDVIAISDGGGKAAAALRPLHGQAAVSAFVIGLAQRNSSLFQVEMALLNGTPAILLKSGNRIDTALLLATTETGIARVLFVRNPDKLRLHSYRWV
ncbi:MAG: RNA polymerase sigma-70 factor [Chloroflexota bacterium]|nr:RNA polymerase sigma-70 factor [Chloroflexota bacterium]